MRLLFPLLLTACAGAATVRGTAVTPVAAPAPSYAVTPNGTSILSWDLKQSDRATIHDATGFEYRGTDIEYVAHPTKDTSVVLLVELVTARVTFSEDGESVTHTAPIKLDVRVLDNGGYLIDRPHCIGPHYQLAAPGAAPEEMLLICDFKATRPNANVGFTIYSWGRGALDEPRR